MNPCAGHLFLFPRGAQPADLRDVRAHAGAATHAGAACTTSAACRTGRRTRSSRPRSGTIRSDIIASDGRYPNANMPPSVEARSAQLPDDRGDDRGADHQNADQDREHVLQQVVDDTGQAEQDPDQDQHNAGGHDPRYAGYLFERGGARRQVAWPDIDQDRRDEEEPHDRFEHAGRTSEDALAGGHRVARHLEHHHGLQGDTDQEQPPDLRSEDQHQPRPHVRLAHADAERDQEDGRPEQVDGRWCLGQRPDGHGFEPTGPPYPFLTRLRGLGRRAGQPLRPGGCENPPLDLQKSLL